MLPVEGVPAALKILFYSPYAGHWGVHTIWESTFAKALEYRGAETHFIGCDQVFAACDVYRNHVPRTDEGCASCKYREQRLFTTMQVPYSWLGDRLTADDRAEVQAWSARMADAQLFNATFDGHPVAEWCLPSLIAHFRQPTFEAPTDEEVRVFRDYLEGAALSIRSLSRYLDSWRPDVVVTLNGTLFSHRVAFELARARGIRVVIHEQATFTATLDFRENMTIWDTRYFDDLRATWQAIPLNTKELEETAHYLHERRYGRRSVWLTFTTLDDQGPSVATQLGLPPDKPITALYTTSEAEASISHWRSIFGDQFAWIQATIDFFASRPDRCLVIRIHPNEDYVMGRNEAILARYRHMAETAPPNVRFVWPKDSLSAYALMDVADVALVYYTTVGIEMAATWGKPVVAASQNGYSGWGFTWEIQQAEDYSDVLEQALATPPSDQVRARALRFLYRQTIWDAIPFPLVISKQDDYVSLAYQSIDELAPGNEPNLDRIVDGILGLRPIYPPPSNEERHRTTADEDRFLATYGAGPDGLRQFVMDHCRVSIILHAYNQASYLGAAMDAILAQTYQDFEVYVLDDGSTDGTPDVMEQYRRDPRVRYEYQPRKGPGGAYQAFNRCLEATQGEYIVVASGDAIMLPEKIERQLAIFQTEPSAEVVLHDGSFIDAGGHPQAGQFNWVIPQRALAGRVVGRHLLSGCPVPSSTAMFRRSILKRIGVQEKIDQPDQQFWLKAALARCRFVYLPEVLVLCRQYEAGQASSADYQRQVGPGAKHMLAAMRSRYTIEDIYPEIAHCEDADGARVAAHLDLGVLMAGSAEACWDLAADEFKQALQLRPDCVLSQNNLACCYLVQGRTNEGLAILRDINLPAAQQNLAIAESLDDPRTGQYQLHCYDPQATALYQVQLPKMIDPRSPVDQATLLAVVDDEVSDRWILGVLAAYFEAFGPDDNQVLVWLATSQVQTERLVYLYRAAAPSDDEAALVAIQQVRACELESVFLGQLLGSQAVIEPPTQRVFAVLARARACPVLGDPTAEQMRAVVTQERMLPALP